MENKFFISTIISIIYFIAKFIDMRYISKNDIPLKSLVKDTILVFVSSAIAYFIIEQIGDVIVLNNPVSAFTGAPDF